VGATFSEGALARISPFLFFFRWILSCFSVAAPLVTMRDKACVNKIPVCFSSPHHSWGRCGCHLVFFLVPGPCSLPAEAHYVYEIAEVTPPPLFPGLPSQPLRPLVFECLGWPWLKIVLYITALPSPRLFISLQCL